MLVLMVSVSTVSAAGAEVEDVEADDPSSGRALAPLFPELERKLHDAYVTRGAASFEPASDGERAQFREAFALLLAEAERSGEPPLPARRALDRLGFGIDVMTVAGANLWAVLEHPHRQRGGGLYLVRPGPDEGAWVGAPDAGRGVTRVSLMSPHPRSDRGTDLIGQRLFVLGRARTYLQATIHRKTSAPDGTEADPAHRADTFFQAATDAIDAHREGQLFLQLHGFESARHGGKLESGVRVVLSDGTSRPEPGPIAAAAVKHLQGRHPGSYVAVFGIHAKRLGGTTNTQGRAINERGRNTFLHMEIAAPVRQEAVEASSGKRPPAGSFFDSLIGLAGARWR
jgi:hypothetical protein